MAEGNGAIFPPLAEETSKHSHDYYQSWPPLWHKAKKTKTYRRFFGTIYFGGVGSTVVVERQLLATRQILKT
jgi:hypothetical protein